MRSCCFLVEVAHFTTLVFRKNKLLLLRLRVQYWLRVINDLSNGNAEANLKVNESWNAPSY